jgi:hypothetical protein
VRCNASIVAEDVRKTPVKRARTRLPTTEVGSRGDAPVVVAFLTPPTIAPDDGGECAGDNCDDIRFY